MNCYHEKKSSKIIKVGIALKEITEILIENGQEHILEHLDLMTAQQKDTLINDLKQVDFKLLDSLFETYKKLSVSKKEKKVFSAADVLSFDEAIRGPQVKKCHLKALSRAAQEHLAWL